MSAEEFRRKQVEAWERGERISVEQLLAGERCNDDTLLELIYFDVILREEAGEAPCCDDYVARFPHLAEQLRRQFEVHELLGSLEGLQSFSALVSQHTSSARAATIVQPGLNHSAVRRDVFPNIPGYEILRELGRGGMGVVYQARHLQLRRTIALKRILDSALTSPAVRERFRVEAAAVARLQHPNIVQIYDFNESGDVPYFSLEYVAGGSLAERVQRRPQPIAAAAALVETLARALDHAHRQGIVHRDVKPANILLARGPADGSASGEFAPESASTLDKLQISDFQPKITDFGLAKDLIDGRELTHTEAVLGTYLYMSPEQAQGKSRDVGPATDIHALGLILYELLTGTAPFQTKSLAGTLDAVRYTEPPPPSSLRADVPAALDAICRRCLQKNPQDRYRTAGELADELARWADGKPLQQTAVTRRGRSRGLIAAVVALGALLLGGAFFWATRGPPARTTPETFAFLVGVRSYRLPNQTLDLEFTESDVDELSRVLHKQGVPRRNIKLLTQWSESDNPELAPTGGNIREQLARMLSECIPGDTVLVAITGMGGDLGQPPMYCYLPADGNPQRPESLLTLADFYQLFGRCPAERKLLLVDTCQTVSAELPNPPKLSDPPPGLAVLFACGPQQASYEHRDLRHGVFSYHVLRALEGAADGDQDGVVRLGELRDFTQQRVAEFVAEKLPGGEQSPRLIGNLPDETPVVSLRSAP